MNSRVFGVKARIATALTTAIGVAALTAGTASASSGPIVFGNIDGTTGAYAATGVVVNQGVAIAVEYINSHGGVLGHKVKAINLNDNASGTLAAQEFQRLISDGAIAVTGSTDTGPAVAAEAEREHFPDVGIVDDGGPTIYADGPNSTPNPWAWGFAVNAYAMGDYFAKWALANCPGGKLALLHDSTSYGVGASQAESATYAAAHKKLTVDDQITEDWTSGATVGLTSEINKVKSSGAKCVDVWLTPQDGAEFLKQVQQLGDSHVFKYILGNDEDYSTGTFAQLAGNLANGVLSGEQITAVHPNKMTNAFVKLFNAKYHPPKSYNTSFAQETFDAMVIVAQVANKAKSTSPSAIQAGLDKVKNFMGASGILSLTAQQHQSITSSQITMIKYNAATKLWNELK